MLNFWKGKGGAAIGQSKSRYAVFKQMLANKKRLLQNRPKGSFTAAVGFFTFFLVLDILRRMFLRSFQ